MAFITDEIQMGHLATVHHQRSIGKVFYGLYKLWQEGSIKLEPLPETDIDPGNPESKCPDVILQDNVLSTVPVIIEIATHRGWRTDFEKMRQLIDTTFFGIEEGFVLDFQTGEWHKYAKGMGAVKSNPSWSEVLRVDLNSLLI